MISPINVFLAFLWSISALADYLDFCYIWQLKEYRIDRMRDYFSTPQGQNYWIKYPLFWRSVFAIIIFFWPINDNLSVKYILMSLFTVDILYVFYKLKQHKLLRPKATKKAILIILISLGIEGTLFLLTRDWSVLFILLILRFFVLSGVTLSFSRITNVIKNYYIKQATVKLAEYPKLIIIGITGSYGKTTVKNYLKHVLSGKFRVFSTPERVNTDIGVAKVILNTDFSDKDIFIVEMGAYKIGEIKKICDMVKPKIGILTAINEQHLSLFGDIAKTQQAKFELINSLPADGLAIINSDNKYCREKINEVKAKVLTFGTDPEYHPTLILKEISSSLQGITCKGEMNGEERVVKSPAVGEYNAMNVAPCYVIARYLGLTADEVIEQISTLTGGLRIVKYGNCDLIDDSYNSNPDGFKAALDILSKFPSSKKRIIITRGMLELGPRSDELHEKISEDISFIADELVVITKDFANPLRKGLIDKYHTNFLLKENPYDLLEYIRNLKNTDSVILLENRVPEIISRELGL